MIMKYYVTYAFVGEDKVYKKSFDNFMDAIKFNGEIIKKYQNSKKKRLEYCKYE